MSLLVKALALATGYFLFKGLNRQNDAIKKKTQHEIQIFKNLDDAANYHVMVDNLVLRIRRECTEKSLSQISYSEIQKVYPVSDWYILFKDIKAGLGNDDQFTVQGEQLESGELGIRIVTPSVHVVTKDLLKLPTSSTIH